MNHEQLHPKPKLLIGKDAEFFLRRVSREEEDQVFGRLTQPVARPMTKEEADTTPGKKPLKRGFRSANPFSIF